MAVTRLLRLVGSPAALHPPCRVHRGYSKLQVSSVLSERLQIFESLRGIKGCKRRPERSEKPLSVRVADGRIVKGLAGVTTPLAVAQSLRLKGVLVSKVNGELQELGRPLDSDCELQLLGFDTAEGKQTAWRTGACVLGGVLEGHFGAVVCREGTSEFGLFSDFILDKKHKEEWEKEQAELRRRDHRRIGTDQELFFFNEVSPGSCFFLPKGAHIYNTLTDFIKSEYRARGFTEVVTPTLYSTALWERSGHWEHYSDNMFTVTSEGSQTYALKPMNCPAHCLMFEQRVRSWRELPMRWADFGALHRNELSGALGGLTRVRRFCQDDAHIFCAPEQLEEEIVSCLDFVRKVYQVFGFSFHCLLSTRPTPCLGEAEQWDNAEQQLMRGLEQFGERWDLNPGDGAFYGPKIDIQIKDAIGRQHQCATIQLDFQLPIRFDLHYVGRDGAQHRPVMIHRAVLGSLERMIAILAENFGGKWPLWLSPVQVLVIPVGGNNESYGREVVRQFHEAGFMVDMNDDQSGTLNKKIRSAQLAQYNYIFVVGDKECESGTVSVRSRGGKQLGRRPTEEVLMSLTLLKNTRSNQDEF
uniref:threonine--tRNA ligase n=1 Tax=Gouania willdenowi TaxID=441366 RepID=A0A8C5EK36_GOUWI